MHLSQHSQQHPSNLDPLPDLSADMDLDPVMATDQLDQAKLDWFSFCTLTEKK